MMEEYLEFEDDPTDELDIDDTLQEENAAWQTELEQTSALFERYAAFSASIESMQDNREITPESVGFIEAQLPGLLTDDVDILAAGGVFDPAAFEIAMEQVIATEFDMALFLMNKFIKLNFRAGKMLAKQSARLAGIVATLADDKLVNTPTMVLTTSIQGADKLPTIRFKDLGDHQKAALTKLVKRYTGLDAVGEAEVIKTIEAVKTSKNGIEILNKVMMPRYSNILLPIFSIPGSDYNGIARFFNVMDDQVMPRVDTNLNTAMMSLTSIMEKRDWGALANFDERIYGDNEKAPLYQLAKHVKANIIPQARFKKHLNVIYGETSELFRAEKKGMTSKPHYNQDLVKAVKSLEKMKEHIVSISDTMSDMSKHTDSRTGNLTRDLRKFRASKTVKESLKGGRRVNKYSNAVYSRLIKELKDVAALSSFMASLGNDVLVGYTGIFTRSHKLNLRTMTFVEQVHKILGNK